jgi:hypothetical protein
MPSGQIDFETADRLWPGLSGPAGDGAGAAAPDEAGNGHAGGKRMRRLPTLVEEQRAWIASKRELVEIEIRRQRGELEERAEAERVLFEEGRRVRDAVLLAGDRAALSLLHQSDVLVVRKLLRQAYTGALDQTDSRGADDERRGAARRNENINEERQ